MEDAIVLYPSPAIGHLKSMAELAKLILTEKPSLAINILITTTPYEEAGSITSYINRVSTTTPSIIFHRLPANSSPTNPTFSPHHETIMFDFLRDNIPNVHRTLISISKSCTVRALIIDFFCTSALTVATQLGIPTFCYFTSGACALASFLYLPIIHQSTNKSLKDLDCKLKIPGLPPVPPTDMAKPVLDRTDKAYEYFLDFCIQMPTSAGIIVNTFEMLEPRVLTEIREGRCVPNGLVPPILCIGPMIAANDKSESGVGDGYLTWLDSQPSQSVVFLCFGSLGLFSLQQLKEIAIGLEKSEKRFLWVVRNPPREDNYDHILASAAHEPNLESLLPDGFLDRTKERGLVVHKWIPQLKVLSHDSVGGFVTHCGWNSVLEAICWGVPMVAWPLYAEQRLNRIMMVEEMKVAVPMEESKDGFVVALEVEMRIRELMDSEKGSSIRKQTMNMKEAARIALSEGGSSRIALTKLIDSWNH